MVDIKGTVDIKAMAAHKDTVAMTNNKHMEEVSFIFIALQMSD